MQWNWGINHPIIYWRWNMNTHETHNIRRCCLLRVKLILYIQLSKVCDLSGNVQSSIALFIKDFLFFVGIGMEGGTSVISVENGRHRKNANIRIRDSEKVQRKNQKRNVLYEWRLIYKYIVTSTPENSVTMSTVWQSYAMVYRNYSKNCLAHLLIINIYNVPL